MTANIIQFKTSVAVPANSLFADPVLANLIEVAKEQARQINAMEQALKLVKNEIRKQIGDFETVIGLNGEITATYNWIKGAETVDKEALKIHFADVYEIVKKIGEPTRRLELK